LNINRRIRASYVRVIGKDGEQLGILDTRQAVQLADSMSLDLVEVAPQADPPVCKIMDYGKYKYQEKKKAQAARKKQVVVELKEVQIRPKTDEHDLSHKAKSTVGFIQDGNKAKVTVVFRGREMEHIDMGWETLKEFLEKLNDQAVIEVMPKMEGKRLSCIVGPIPPGKKLPAGHLLASLPKAPPVRRSFQSGGGMGAPGPSGGASGGPVGAPPSSVG
jgi:translation initiation factor IF-3